MKLGLIYYHYKIYTIFVTLFYSNSMDNAGPLFLLNQTITDSQEFNDDFLQSGKNLYEVVRVMKNKVIFMEDHISRLFESAHKSGLNISYSASELYQGLMHLVHSLRMNEGNIKIIWHTGDPFRDSFLIMYQVKHYYPENYLYHQGVQCSILNESRPDPGIKKWRSTFRETIHQLKATEGVYEIILVNGKGIVTEGSQSNLFIIKGNRIYTAFKKNILPGITRKYIFKIARENGLTLEERDFNIATLLSSDSVFLTGTSPKVLPVSQIGHNTFDVSHPLLRKIISLYDLEIYTYLNTPGQ